MISRSDAKVAQGQIEYRSVPEFVEELKALTAEIQEPYCQDQVPWIVGYSGGKDSTAVLQLVWNAIAALPLQQRTKPVHIISTDTRVENPVISAWVNQSLNRMAIAAQQKGLPFQPHPLQPEVEDSFWVNLIGRGYPAPRQKFRWCTERLKIHPANRFIRNVVRASGETILVLGTRKAESQKRAATMAKHAEDSKQKEVTHVPGAYIKSWREYLLRRLLETQASVREKAPD